MVDTITPRLPATRRVYLNCWPSVGSEADRARDWMEREEKEKSSHGAFVELLLQRGPGAEGVLGSKTWEPMWEDGDPARGGKLRAGEGAGPRAVEGPLEGRGRKSGGCHWAPVCQALRPGKRGQVPSGSQCLQRVRAGECPGAYFSSL